MGAGHESAPAPDTDQLGLDDLQISGLGLVAVLLFAFVLFAVLKAARWVVKQLPLSKSRRSTLARFRPVLEALTTVVYLLISVPIVFAGHREFTPLVLAILLFGMIGVSWFAIRDFVNGMSIKASQLCDVGDRVTIDEHSGVVRQLGYRVLTLAADDGTEVLIPFGRLTRQSIVRTPRAEGAHRHDFEIELPNSIDPIAAIAKIKQLALTCHWASVARTPDVEIVSGRRVIVHAFALGREHGPAIEAVVRAGLPLRAASDLQY
jgi:small-conductance mechanosensitive channel